jgi:CheY-like chemotaxis protein
MKLLIVDDHSAMRRLIGRVVSDMVSEIEECDDGAKALAAYHRCLPDWVLMDIEMDQVEESQRPEKSSFPFHAQGS